MSTIEHTASVTIGKIPLGRRISELMQEKGDAFSIRAFAERLGVNRETFRLTLLGERPVSITLLENISRGLKIDEDRIRQRDTYKMEEELISLLNTSRRTKETMLRAQTLASELVKVALGFTERCMCWANLGRAQYYLQKYDLAHESFLTAMEYAEKVNESFGDSTLLYHVTSFLMVSFTIRKEYTNIVHTLNIVEKVFADDPEKMGYVHYTRMKWDEHRGNFEQAKTHAYIALDYFAQTKSKSQIGKAQLNVAHFEYLMGNYQKAKEELTLAMDNLKSIDYFYLLAVKDYLKVLMQLNENDKASQVILANSTLASEYPDFMGMFQIMYSVVQDNPSFAISVSEDTNMSRWIRNIACRSLMDYYASKGDAVSLMRYYEQVRSSRKNEYFEEGF
ncbi:helix-turn-helix domain-containing protein [Tumebacillus lipolyticus]|uniref:Helix-turn-helix domain-containing protein n=1 Tax=Tumebacillus lipolyticus TaxID=1280370 RepID=A0ABW5A166_9BACL